MSTESIILSIRDQFHSLRVDLKVTQREYTQEEFKAATDRETYK